MSERGEAWQYSVPSISADSGSVLSSATSSSPSGSAVRAAISSIGAGASWRSTSQRSALPRIQVAFSSFFSRSTVSFGHAPAVA